MKPRSVLLLAVAIAALGGLWLLTRSAPAPDPAAPSATGRRSPPPDPASATAPERVPVAAVVGEGLRVRVVGKGNAPVAGAVVQATGDDPLRFPPTNSDGIAAADRFPAADIQLRVEHAGWSGVDHWRWNGSLTREVTVRLRADRDVEVAVRDEGARPIAGAAVQLIGDDDRLPAGQAWGRTDERGIVRLPVPGSNRLAWTPNVRAITVVDGETFRSTPTPWAATGPTSLAIVVARNLPAAGPTLTIHFVDAAGAEARAVGQVWWSRITTSSTGTVEWPAGSMEVDGTFARIASTRSDDHLRFQLHETERLASSVEVRMPPGVSNHQVLLQRGARAPRLEIPLVRASGEPVTDGDFQLYGRFAVGLDTVDERVRPDPRGVLVVVLPGTDAGTIEVARAFLAGELHWPATPGIQRPYYTTFGRPPPPDPAIAVMPFPACAPDTTHRLAPVVVPDLVARIVGRVVDAEGLPVAGVRIGITSVETPEPKEFAPFATLTDDGGGFLIRATGLPEQVYVFGRRRLGFCAPVRVQTGGAPVQLTLQPTGTLAMLLRAPTDLPQIIARLREHPSIAVVIDDGGQSSGWWGLFRDRASMGRGELLRRWHDYVYVHDAGEVLIEDLLPAIYEVRGHIGLNEVARVPGVRIEAGRTTRPPQLDGQPFGDGIEATCVRVRGPDGAPRKDAVVCFTIPEWKDSAPGGTNARTDVNGEAWFAVPRNLVTDVRVLATGLAEYRQLAARFPLEVTMGAGTAFDVAITGHAALEHDVRRLVVSCREHGDSVPDKPVKTFLNSANVGDDGRCTIENLTPGRWRVWLSALLPDEDRSGTAFTFVLLGDYAVTADGPPRLEIRRELGTADLATLRGR